MKGSWQARALLCLGILILGAGVVRGQSTGSIVGWGDMVVVEPSVLEGLVAVACGHDCSVGLKVDGTIVAWGDNSAGECNVPAPDASFVKVVAGDYHGLGLKSDGTIAAWGWNLHGECNVPAPNAGFFAVAAGGYHSLGLKSGGTIVAWGDNSFGQNNVPWPNTGFAAVAAGADHSLGLKSDGSIVAWGRNTYGECNVPAPNTGFRAVAGGYAHSLGVKFDGTIVAWGDNTSGQCNVPAPNAGFVAVACGDGHSLGVKSDGTIVAWGDNTYGQCSVPSPNAGFVAASGGYGHSMGLRSDRTVEVWGWNHRGQCNVPSPNSSFVAVAAGWAHGLGLKPDGAIMTWGRNSEGQCNVPSPNAGFVAVAGGKEHSLGFKSDGAIVAWGDNSYGQCNVPAPNAGFVALSGGWTHSLGLKSDGTIVAWGDNTYGQCNVPTPNAGFVAVAGGGEHSLGLKSDGTIVAWGDNTSGQCNVPSPNEAFVAVAGGGEHSLGLKSDGTIVAWGDNTSGQCNVPTPNAGFVAVTAGGYHSMGLKSDGTVVAWGDNSHGQCNVPTPNAGFAAVAAGVLYSLGLRGPMLGACCVGGACTATLQSDCQGTWEGSGTTCDPNPCPQASWWDPAWMYRKPLSVAAPAAGYQMRIRVFRENGHDNPATGEIDCEGHCRADFGDLRFVDGVPGTSLSYWIEGTGMAGSDHYADVWVKIPGGTPFYLYYGNSTAATTSDGPSTFAYYDHWDADDTGQWHGASTGSNTYTWWENVHSFSGQRALESRSFLTTWNSGSWDYSHLGWTQDKTSYPENVESVLLCFSMKSGDGATATVVPVRLKLRHGGNTHLTSFILVPKPDPSHPLSLSLRYATDQVSCEWKDLQTGAILASLSITDPTYIPDPANVPYLVITHLDASGGILAWSSPTSLQWGNQPGNGGCTWLTDYWFNRQYATNGPTWESFGSEEGSATVSIRDNGPDRDSVGELLVCRPSPFTRASEIVFDLATPEDVTIRVFDVVGRQVRKLCVGQQGLGRHNRIWDGQDDRGADVPAGVYLVRLQAGHLLRTSHVVRIR